MFTNTKYTNWYYNIILNALQLNRSKKNGMYYELHHITPKSLGGNNSNSNLVLLTAREHYVCHLLLPKMCISSDHKRRMVYAFMRLSEGIGPHNINHHYNAKMYEYFKIRYSTLISGPNCYMYGVPKTAEQRAKISATRKQNKTGAGENNPMYGKKHSAESIQKMSEVKHKRIQERGVDVHHAKQITANPKSRQVQIEDGRIFPSLSEASRVCGFADVGAGRRRIQKGIWKYV